jgi:hypothetical protein
MQFIVLLKHIFFFIYLHIHFVIKKYGLEFYGFSSDVAEYSVRLGSDTASLVNRVLSFRGNVVSWTFKLPKIRIKYFLETFLNFILLSPCIFTYYSVINKCTNICLCICWLLNNFLETLGSHYPLTLASHLSSTKSSNMSLFLMSNVHAFCDVHRVEVNFPMP